MITEIVQDSTSDGTTITVGVMKDGSEYVYIGTLLVENFENGDGTNDYQRFHMPYRSTTSEEWLDYFNNYESSWNWTVTDKLHPETYLDNF